MSLSADVNNCTDGNNSTTMQIAVQVLKERCFALQKRILSLEEENCKLKVEHVGLSDVPIKEKDLLVKIVDLTKQKSQLSQYVLMMTCENKKLWEYISKISPSKIVSSQDKTVNDVKNELTNNQPKTTGLLRSETFIQSAPNTKQLSKTIDDHYNDCSLEEISLKLINSFLQEKSDLVNQYEQMVDLQATDDTVLNKNSFGFNLIDNVDGDILGDVKTQIDKMNDVKKEIKQQQCDLQNLLSILEGLKLDQDCKNCETAKRNDIHACKQNQSSKTETFNEIEILDSLTKWATPENSTSYQDNTCDQMSLSHIYSKKDDTSNKANMDSVHLDKVTVVKYPKQEEFKMCPMCGMYLQNVSFDVFTKHVQDHFVRESNDDSDSIVDNFELIINSVGNGLN